jgi:uncharacterized protein YgiB involved in biofilm formation
MNNKRNQYGVKDCIDGYRNINGELYTQWSDWQTKKDCEKEYPKDKFIQRKENGFVRIYKKVG